PDDAGSTDTGSLEAAWCEAAWCAAALVSGGCAAAAWAMTRTCAGLRPTSAGTPNSIRFSAWSGKLGSAGTCAAVGIGVSDVADMSPQGSQRMGSLQRGRAPRCSLATTVVPWLHPLFPRYNPSGP